MSGHRTSAQQFLSMLTMVWMIYFPYSPIIRKYYVLAERNNIEALIRPSRAVRLVIDMPKD